MYHIKHIYDVQMNERMMTEVICANLYKWKGVFVRCQIQKMIFLSTVFKQLCLFGLIKKEIASFI